MTAHQRLLTADIYSFLVRLARQEWNELKAGFECFGRKSGRLYCPPSWLIDDDADWGGGVCPLIKAANMDGTIERAMARNRNPKEAGKENELTRNASNRQGTVGCHPNNNRHVVALFLSVLDIVDELGVMGIFSSKGSLG